VGGQEVRQKPLKTGFAELAAQMGKLEQIVEIVIEWPSAPTSRSCSSAAFKCC